VLAAGAAAPTPTPLARALESVGCPRGAEGEIIVCRRGDARQRYRIPETLRSNGFDVRGSVDSVSRERNRLIDAGAAGEMSCSTVGTNGHAGCQIREFRAWRQQKGE